MIKAICFEYFNLLVTTDFFFLHMGEWLDTLIELKITEEQKTGWLNKIESYINENQNNSYDFLTLSCEGMEVACLEYGFTVPKHAFESHTKMRIVMSRLPQNNLKILQQLKKKYKIGILSRDKEEHIRTSCRRLPFQFNFIVCTNGEKNGKESISIYESAANLAECDVSELLIVSDRIHELSFPKGIGAQIALLDLKKKTGQNILETFSSIEELEEYILKSS
jgi:FMN phosphatase YigB (HAD superfamily)